MRKYIDKYFHTGTVLLIDTIVSFMASASVIILVYLLIPTFSFADRQIATWFIGSIAGSLIAFIIGKGYKAIIRYSAIRELGKFSIICAGKEILLWTAMVLSGSMGAFSNLLIGMIIIDLVLTFASIIFIRVIMVAGYDYFRKSSRHGNNRKKILVYGVGDKSAGTISRLRNSPHFQISGFIEYDETKHSRMLSNLNVYGFESSDNVKQISEITGIDGILFPYVADARAEQDRLIRYCQENNLKIYIAPGIDEISEGTAIGNYIRKIKIEDLLGRPEIDISMNEIIDNFSGKVVLVTGAAGSIGSELCRQLTAFGVKLLILFDNAETPLHNIRLELEDKYPHLNFVPVIGDVRSAKRLDFVFKKYHPHIVFHAAAYKHVPLMEENPCEAMLVNVTGSRQVADKCVEYDVEKMVMVSTDKAVNPTNIMGCTKRLAEIYVQSLGLAIERGLRPGKTKFVTTRFGNVLGSNGSVIPRFREQIENGGPVTVTHPEIRRFFMTIPEACRLVMEAATFSTGTQIFVFDMGEPVKIAALARRMIELAGLEPDNDIRIEFTGLRPGEKLYEEVLATKENTIPTQHSRIFVAKVREYDFIEIGTNIVRLSDYAKEVAIPEMVRLMKRIVPEFKSKHSEFEKYDKIDNL